MEVLNFLGNQDLLKLSKTAFLCSQKIPASIVLKCYDWAIGQRESGNCIISGFHSQLEKDVLHYLIKGTQPIIMALARGLKTDIHPEFQKSLDQGRLLIITPFEDEIEEVTEETATVRNRFTVELAENVTIGHVSAGGKLETLVKAINKKVCYL